MLRVDENGELYIYESNHTISDDDGLLHLFSIVKPEGVSKNRNPFEGMLLTNKNYGLYTYYTYQTDFGNIVWKNNGRSFYLTPQGDKVNPNGSPTVLVESCTVIFGGREDVYTKVDESAGEEKSGGEHSTGGFSVN